MHYSNLLPQFPQNSDPSFTLLPQFGQKIFLLGLYTLWPHEKQKGELESTSAPQFVQNNLFEINLKSQEQFKQNLQSSFIEDPQSGQILVIKNNLLLVYIKLSKKK